MFPRTRAKKKNSLKKVEWRARIWGRAWLAKHKRIDYAKRRVTLTNGLWAFFFFCLAGSIIYLPFLYPIVKNDITWPPPPVHNFDRVSLPHNLTKPDNKTEDQVAYVYLNLTTDTDFVVGNELNLSVIVYTTPTLLQNMQAFAVVPDGALIYGPYEHIFNSFVPMKSSYTPNSELLTWSGSQLIEYTVPGSYGLGLSFFNYTKSE